MPGGRGSRREVDNPVFIDFIRRQAAGCRAVLSVCTGSFLLERAGVLANKRATTHWGELPKAAQTQGSRSRRGAVREDGNVWVGAGVSAGTDLALAFIASEAGEEVASQVQFFAEYYPSPKRYGRAHKRRTGAGIREGRRRKTRRVSFTKNVKLTRRVLPATSGTRPPCGAGPLRVTPTASKPSRLRAW